jgi:hypothetical protein
VCLWSHGGWEPVHIHFVVQPVSDELRELSARPGPSLQVALSDAAQPPEREAVEEIATEARRLFGAPPSPAERPRSEVTGSP